MWMAHARQLRIEAVFQPGYPYVQTARLCLLEDPLIDFEIRPMGGMDIMDVRP